MAIVTISAMIAAALMKTLAEKGKDFLVDKGLGKMWDLLTTNKKTFQTELTSVIEQTISTYESQLSFESTSSSKIPFYQSQTLIEELLKYSFINEMDETKVLSAIEADTRIIPPSEGQIRDFVAHFNKMVRENQSLKGLFIEHNYKEEIFNIAGKLSAISSTIENKIQNLQDSIHIIHNPDLIEEWNKQLEEIKEDYKAIKHKSALKRVKEIRKRIDESGLANDAIKAKVMFIQSLYERNFFKPNCNNDTSNVSRLIIQAYNLQPSNYEYKQQAVVAYFSLGELNKAGELANQILSSDEFNCQLGWFYVIAIRLISKTT